MPKYARDALIHRLEQSGILDRLSCDVRILFRKRLRFNPEPNFRSGSWVEAQLQVGVVTLGYLALPASQSAERNTAYRHWLEMACRVFAQELGSPHPQLSDVLPAKITRAARLVRERHDAPLSLGDIAEEVGLSRERLSRLFHETLGITFSDYLAEVRLGRARQLLAEGSSPVTEIAFASGFQSISQFNRRFLQAEGVSPSEYRRQRSERL